MFISHPLIKENTIEARIYQEVIVASAAQRNTLVVAPTGLGKTEIAVLLAAHRLEKFGGKILMLSSTRPLVNQHAQRFKNYLHIGEEEVNVFTGFTAPEKRDELWKKSKVICATPQVIENDLVSGRYSLSDVSLLVFDEAHRATGDYPYTFIAGEYAKAAKNLLILALTASPGGDEEKIVEVCENLQISSIEIRTERDADVQPYIKGVEIQWRQVALPEQFAKIKSLLESVLKQRLEQLKKLQMIRSASAEISKKELLELRGKLQQELANGSTAPGVYGAISDVAACINLAHALELLETQGLETLQKYFERIQRSAPSKAVKNLLSEINFLRAIRLTESLAKEMHHPKLDALAQIVEKERGKKIMIFTQYRDSANKILERLEKIEGVKPVRFVGQASRERDKGLTQRQQLEIIEKFRNGEYNALVATSVGEEGLDIPKVDLVIFYEPVPSEIRSIQRRGRTGRQRAGRVVVLITKKTRDEWFYWSSFRKERAMREVLEKLKKKFRTRTSTPLSAIETVESLPSHATRGNNVAADSEEKEQRQLSDFFEKKYSIIVDSRELAASVARELLNFGILSKPQKLDVGDYVLSSRVCIERKSVEDFLQSIIDARLLEQVLKLKQSYPKPVLILEGEGLYTKRDLHPNAIRGALAAIAIDFGVPIISSRDEKETAALITAIVKREQEERGEIQIRVEKRIASLRDQQEFIVAGLPNINAVLARRLLKEFKSVRKVFNASEEELQKVRGVGEQTAKEIRHVATSEYEGGEDD